MLKINEDLNDILDLLNDEKAKELETVLAKTLMAWQIAIKNYASPKSLEKVRKCDRDLAIILSKHYNGEYPEVPKEVSDDKEFDFLTIYENSQNDSVTEDDWKEIYIYLGTTSTSEDLL